MNLKRRNGKLLIITRETTIEVNGHPEGNLEGGREGEAKGENEHWR